jgi:drug/metabolite transporter (DMT)-like permease
VLVAQRNNTDNRAMPAAMHLQFWLLAAIWGASFLFIRLAVPTLGAFATAGVRVALAAGILFLLGRALSKPLGTQGQGKRLAIVGVFNSGVPFALYGLAAIHMPVGYAAILNAATPLWTALFCAWFGLQRFTWSIVGACAVAAVGISLMVKLSPAAPTTAFLLAVAACLGSTACYGFSAAFAKRHLAQMPGYTLAAYSQLFAALALAPFVWWTWPTAPVAPVAWGSVLMLAVVCSALAYVLYFSIITKASATVAGSVTFVIPAFGIFWGWLFLGEPVTLSMGAGFALVLVATFWITRPVAKS